METFPEGDNPLQALRRSEAEVSSSNRRVTVATAGEEGVTSKWRDNTASDSNYMFQMDLATLTKEIYLTLGPEHCCRPINLSH